MNVLGETLFLLLSKHCTDFDEIWFIYASKFGFSSLFKSSLYDLCSSNYANEILGSYIVCILTNVSLYVTM